MHCAVNGQAGTLWMEEITWPQHLPSRYFSLTVNKRTQESCPLKQQELEFKTIISIANKAYRFSILLFYTVCLFMDLGCQRAFLNHFLWMGIVICKLMWLIKIASFLNAQIAAMKRRKRFHWTRYELNGDNFEMQVIMFMKPL